MKKIILVMTVAVTLVGCGKDKVSNEIVAARLEYSLQRAHEECSSSEKETITVDGYSYDCSKLLQEKTTKE